MRVGLVPPSSITRLARVEHTALGSLNHEIEACLLIQVCSRSGTPTHNRYWWIRYKILKVTLNFEGLKA